MTKPRRTPARPAAITLPRKAAPRPSRPVDAQGDGGLTRGQFQHWVEALSLTLPAVAPADVELKHFFRAHPKLGSRDRALIAEGVYAVLRRRRLLEYCVPKGEPRKLALACLVKLQGYSLAKVADLCHPGDLDWLAPLKAESSEALPLAVRADLPDWVVTRLQTELDDASLLKLAHAMQSPAPLDLRVNTYLAQRDEVLARFKSDGIAAVPTPHSPVGIRLRDKIALNAHPLFLQGQVEVQDEGSQLLGLVLEARRGEMVADFCAGAGGKALLLGAAMQSQGRVYAFDISEKRLNNLGLRLKRSGLSNLQAVRLDSENDAKVKRLAGKFDRVLVDAPCTGLGTLRRNPDLKWRQTEAGLAELNRKQASILGAAARLVKPGGRLVYATCSLLREENEILVEAFLQHHTDFSLLPAGTVLARIAPELAGMSPWLKLTPHEHGTDGFFAAILVRAKAASTPSIEPAHEQTA